MDQNLSHNFFSAVPYVLDGGATEGACSGCLNTQGNRAVFVDAKGAAGVQSDEVSAFQFQVCARCGTLDLIKGASDEGALYADNYYSFHPRRKKLLEQTAFKLRNRYELSGAGRIGKMLAGLWPGPQHRSLQPLLNGTFGHRLNKDMRLLDVGCGAGTWLAELATEGFTDLSGIDPFLESDYSAGPINIFKGGVERAEGTFDVITAHHSFEHIQDGETALSDMASKLSVNGVIVVRIPLGASYGWLKYGGNWIQLDQPRHMHLYSVAGMKALADRLGLETIAVHFDSIHFMVTGSEARIAGMRPHTRQNIPSRGIQKVFGRAYGNRIAEFTNRLGTADQGAFYFRVKPKA